ncbi:MAG: GNAT family N-acetyltransferase [Clostridia bacterium]|nr:GNAT family N-acetyltransferase [Clostridia bacterium]
MTFPEIPFTLKSGASAILRPPRESDAAEMLSVVNATTAETEFIIRYPEECDDSVEKERLWLKNMLDSPLHMCIVAEVDGRIAGNCSLSFNRRIKTRHRATIGIVILREFWNMGIGTAMFRAMEDAARARGITQLELQFIEGNVRGRALYEKMGFRIVSMWPNAVKLRSGELRAEYLMIKELA